MSEVTRSIDLYHNEIIYGRDNNPGTYIRSVSLHQVDGNFVVTRPLKNDIVIYPQSPNRNTTSIGSPQIIDTLYSFGTFKFPLDAKVDYARNTIWVADTGNNRVLNINYKTLLPVFEIQNTIFPYVVTPNENTGGVFVRGFINTTDGIIYEFSNSGELINQIVFKSNFPFSTFTLSQTLAFGYEMGLPSTVDYDHVRNRLWWTANNTIYMSDLNNSEIYTYDMPGNISNANAIEVEYSTGNTFIGCRPSNIGNYVYPYALIIQMFRDNNRIINTYRVMDSNIEEDTTKTWPTSQWHNSVIFGGFGNPYMNGTWIKSGAFMGQNHSYYNSNCTLNSFPPIVDRAKWKTGDFFSFGTYAQQVNGSYKWTFTCIYVFEKPKMAVWIYDKSGGNIEGSYSLSSFGSTNSEFSNIYIGDGGSVTLV